MDASPCSQQSLDAGEPLYGTAAAEIERWLLLEHDGQWHREALATESIPDEVRAHLAAWLQRTRGARFQLIRDDRAEPLAFPRRLFIVTSREGQTRVRRLVAASWQEILACDLDRLADGPAPVSDDASADEPPIAELTGPLVLVCTHGRRDVCCARAGVPVFRELARDFGRDHPGRIWQTTHLGGHRFAATLVLLPHAYTYGRLDVNAARRVVRGYLAGRLTDLDRLRGRSCYPADVQYAEYWVRENAGRVHLESLQLKRHEAEHGKSEVTFWDGQSDDLHELTVVVDETSELASTSCGEPPKPVRRHRIESYRKVHGATRDFRAPGSDGAGGRGV